MKMRVLLLGAVMIVSVVGGSAQADISSLCYSGPIICKRVADGKISSRYYYCKNKGDDTSCWALSAPALADKSNNCTVKGTKLCISNISISGCQTVTTPDGGSCRS